MLGNLSRFLLAIVMPTWLAVGPGGTAIAHADESTKTSHKPRVRIETSHGTLVVELFPARAAITVKNFLRYVDEKRYDDTLFHQIIDPLLVQGGAYRTDGTPVATFEPIRSEATNGLRNTRGTLAMVRKGSIHSATSEFLINAQENPFLNHRGKLNRDYGYTVFGKVVRGMAVLDAMKKVEVAPGRRSRHEPKEPVILRSIRREPAPGAEKKEPSRKPEK